MPRPRSEAETSRPQIWIDGRQRPRFDLRAWAVVGTAMARRFIAARLQVGAAGLSRFGLAVAEGRHALPTAWLGKAARALPTRARVAHAIQALADRMADAHDILSPHPAAAETVAYPDLIRHQTAAPKPDLDEDAALSAIRAVLREPAADPTPSRPAPSAPATSGVIALALSHLIAWGGVILSLPVGLAQAGLYHLNGGDLADWD